jgi:hypothetical protein
VEQSSKHALHVAAPIIVGTGRELITGMRIDIGCAEQGASATPGAVKEVS